MKTFVCFAGIVKRIAPHLRRRCSTGLLLALGVILCCATFSVFGRAGHGNWTPPAGKSDLTLLQCGNLIYGGSQSSVCFADRFLTDVAQQTNLRVNKSFCPVRLDAEALFDYPFCVMSGNEDFSLPEKERTQLRKFLTEGGFLLVSPGCSDEKWDKAFRRELKICFPQYALQKIPMTHPIFSTVNQIPRLTDKHGSLVSLEGLEINGRLVLVYSKDGLNDVSHASGCCCCGGNEVNDPARVNVNVFTYAVLY
jgi:hypothetical protein